MGEAADLLLAQLAALGVVFHDVGKVLHPAELAAPGHAHEPAGAALVLRVAGEAALARCCASPARWADGAAFEELLVAPADHRWTGKRGGALEQRILEAVAAGGPERLERVLNVPA